MQFVLDSFNAEHGLYLGAFVIIQHYVANEQSKMLEGAKHTLRY